MVDKSDWLKQREDFKKRLEVNKTQDEPAKEKIVMRPKLSIPSIFSSQKSKVEDDKKHKRMTSVEPYSKTNFNMVHSMSKSVDCLSRSGSELKNSSARMTENAEIINSKAALKEMKSDNKVTKNIIDSKFGLQGNSSEIKSELINEDIKITKDSIPKSSGTVNPNRKLIDSMVLDIKPYQSRNVTPILLLPSPMSPLTNFFEAISSPTGKSPQTGHKEQYTTESSDTTKTSNNVLRKLTSVTAQNDQTLPEDIQSSSNKVRKISSAFSQMFSNEPLEIQRSSIRNSLKSYGPKNQNTRDSLGISKNNNAIKLLSANFSQKVSKELQDKLDNNNSSVTPSLTKDDLNEIISSPVKNSAQSSSNKDHSKDIPNVPDERVTQLQKQTISSFENVNTVKPPREITKKLSNISLDESQNTLNNDEEGVVIRKKNMTPQSTTMCFDFTSKTPTSPLLKSNSTKNRSAILLDAPISRNVQEDNEVVKIDFEGNIDTINKIDILLKENYDKAKNDVNVNLNGNLIDPSYGNVKLNNIIANDTEINIMNNSELNNNLSCDPIYENFEVFRNHVPRIVYPTSTIKKLPIAQVRVNSLKACSVQASLRTSN